MNKIIVTLSEIDKIPSKNYVNYLIQGNNTIIRVITVIWTE